MANMRPFVFFLNQTKYPIIWTDFFFHYFKNNLKINQVDYYWIELRIVVNSQSQAMALTELIGPCSRKCKTDLAVRERIVPKYLTQK